MDYIKSIIKSLVDNGAFGPVQFVSISYDEDKDKGYQFASIIHFITINTINDGNEECHKVVVKVQPEITEAAGEAFGNEDFFKNEITGYQNLLPFINGSKLFPKMFYGKFSDTNNLSEEILIIEDLRESGHRLAKHSYLLDYDHLSLTMKNLGRFHALSLIAKRDNPTLFQEYASQYSKSRFEPMNKNSQLMYATSMKRGCMELYNKGIETEVINLFIEKLEKLESFIKNIFKPEEPFSVVCHGDFNKNNIMFKYDNDLPIDLKFFDLQNLCYTSPAIDISFILYMNTTKTDRDKHWDNYLNIYWDGLLSVLPDPGFSYEEFYSHFSKRAIYGYIPSAFFLPFTIDNFQTPAEDIMEATDEKKIEFFSIVGGDEGTSAVVDIFQHLLDKKYLQNCLELP